MNIENLSRRFIFINDYTVFKNEALPYLLEHNRDAIVFIASNKTIWTNGVEFNADSVKKYVDNVREQLTSDQSAIQDQIQRQLQDIVTNSNAAQRQLEQDIEDAQRRLEEAERIANELEQSGYTKESHEELDGIIKDIEGDIAALVQWKQDLYAENGLFKTLVTYDDFKNNQSTVFRDILNIFESSWSQTLDRIDIDENISSKISEQWRIFENGNAQWKMQIEKTVDDINTQYDNIYVTLKTGLDSQINAAVERGIIGEDNKIRAILSALNLEIDQNGNPSWRLSAASEFDNPVIAAIYGWLTEDGSVIDINADRIKFSGKTISQYISEWLKDDDNNTAVGYDGVLIQSGNNYLELKQSESFSGLRHYTKNGSTTSEGSFQLSIDGSGFLGKKTQSNIHHPIEWDNDSVKINYNFLTDDNGDPANFGNLGGYTISIFTSGRKSETARGIIPELPGNEWVWGQNQTYIQTGTNPTWLWYRSASIQGYDPNENDLWMAQRTVRNDGSIIDGYNWQGPWCISGADGSPGTDGGAINYLFIHTKTNTFLEDENYNNDDLTYVPNSPSNNKDGIGQWKEDAFSEGASLTETYKFVWMCYSTTKIVDGDTEYYTNYSEPIIWARWGKDGIDGNGVEYIFIRTNSANITFTNTNNPSTWAASQEYPYQLPGNSEWQQDPPELIAQGQVAWVSMRKTNSDGQWQTFSPPTIWAYYSIDGQSQYAYTLDFVKEDLVVSVDKENGLPISTYDKNVLMQAWDPSGESIKSLREVINSNITTGKCFVLDIGDSSVALSQGGNSVDWKEFIPVYGDQSTIDPYGNSVHVHIIGIDEYTSPTLLSPSQSYITPESILDKHIYCDITVKIYNVADIYTNSNYNTHDVSPVYERTVELSVFGVYTGADGQSIDLKTSTDLISISSTGVISPSTVSVFCLLVSGSENKTITTSIPNGTDDPNNEGFIFKYKIGIDTDTDWYNVPNGGNISIPSNINTDKSLYINLLYHNDITQPVKLISSRTIPVVKDGEKGNTGESTLRSYIFTRCNDIAPLSPSNSLIQQESDLPGVDNDLGTFNQPIPHGKYDKVYGLDENDNLVDLETEWYDGVPYGQKQLWESFATFYSNETGPHTEWSTPTPVMDTVDLDIEFSNVENYEEIDDIWKEESDRNQHGWYDANDIGRSGSDVQWDEIIWRAERKLKNGVYDGPWSYIRIRGERGLTGESGVFIYLDNQCDIIPVDANGKVGHDVTLSTNVTLFDGSHAQALNASSLPITTNQSILEEIEGNEHPISYNNGVATVQYIIPEGTIININNSNACNVIISVTYNDTQYSAIFSISVVEIGNDKYTLKYNRNQFLFNKIDTDSEITYDPIYDTVDISFNHETNEGISEVYRLPQGYTLKCYYTGDNDTNNTVYIENLNSDSISAIGDTTDCIYTSASTTDSPITIHVNPIINNGDIVYKELCIELYYPNELYNDKQTFLLQSTGLDGRGKRFILDLDNDSDGVLCDNVGDKYRVRKDTVIETNIRFYDEGVQQQLTAINPSYNNYISYTTFDIYNRNGNQLLLLDQSYGDAFTIDSESDYKAYFRITIKKDTLLLNKRNDIQFSVKNQTGTYYGVLRVYVETSAVYNILPDKKSIVFVDDGNGQYSPTSDTIDCSTYTITDANGIQNKSYTGVEDDTVIIQYRYERGDVSGNWNTYDSGELTIYPVVREGEENIYSHNITGVTFKLIEAADTEENTRSIETIPVLYSIKGDVGPSTEVVQYSVIMLTNTIQASPDGTTGNVELIVNKTTYIGTTSNSVSVTDSDHVVTISLYGESEYIFLNSANYYSNIWSKSIQSSELHKYIYVNVYKKKVQNGNTTYQNVYQKEIPLSNINRNFMYYPAGIWDENKRYEITNGQIPYVNYYDETAGRWKYYYLLQSYPQAQQPNIQITNTSYWSEISQMSVVISDAIMSDYGKLGDAIFYDGMMFSKNGKYNNNNVEYDEVIQDSNEIAASRVVSTTKILNSVKERIVSPDSNISLSNPIYLRSGIRLDGDITHNVNVNILDKVYPEGWQGQQSTGFFLKPCDSIGNLQNVEGINLIGNNGFYFNKSLLVNAGWYKVYFVNRTSNAIQLTASLNIDIKDAFCPNWCVDLCTGRMSSGAGSFVAEQNGDLTIGRGNLIIKEDGNVNIGRGAFTVNNQGEVSIGNGNFTVDSYGNITATGRIQCAAKDWNTGADLSSELTYGYGQDNPSQTVRYKTLDIRGYSLVYLSGQSFEQFIGDSDPIYLSFIMNPGQIVTIQNQNVIYGKLNILSGDFYDLTGRLYNGSVGSGNPLAKLGFIVTLQEKFGQSNGLGSKNVIAFNDFEPVSWASSFPN